VKDDEYEGHEQAKKVTKMGVTAPFWTECRTEQALQVLCLCLKSFFVLDFQVSRWTASRVFMKLPDIRLGLQLA
jgi:hypothetical protein